MAIYSSDNIVFPVVANHADIATPDAGSVAFYILVSDGLFYTKNSSNVVTAVGSSGDGDFLSDGSVAMTGDINLDGHAIKLDDISTPGSNPAAGKFKLYLKGTDLYLLDSAGAETKLTRVAAGDFKADGSVSMTAEFVLGANDFLVTQMSTPSAPAATKYRLYMKSDGTLYRIGSTGSEVGFLLTNGSILWTGDMDANGHGLKDLTSLHFNTGSNPGTDPGVAKAWFWFDGTSFIFRDHAGNAHPLFNADGSQVFSGDLALGTLFKLTQMTTPGTFPGVGEFKIYIKSDGNLYAFDHSGAEVKLTRTGDFFASGATAMTGDFNLDAHAILIDDISTPGSNPAAGKFKLYIKGTDLYLLDSAGTETKITRVTSGDLKADGSVAMTADFNLDAHAILIDDISTPGSNPVSGKFKLYLKGTDLYLLDSTGAEAKLTRVTSGDFLKNGTIEMSGEFQLGGNDFLMTPITTPVANPASGKLKLYMKADGLLYTLDHVGVETQIGSGGGGSGDFMADGSVDMTGDLVVADHAIVMGEIATPSDPAAGMHAVYFKADHKFYALNESGVEVELGAPGADGTNGTNGADGANFSGTSFDLAFDPTTDANWPEGVPANAGDAIDILAARTPFDYLQILYMVESLATTQSDPTIDYLQLLLFAQVYS